MPEGRAILSYSVDRIDVVFVQNSSVIRGINVAICNVDREIVEGPADRDSTFVEPSACAVAKVEKSIHFDYMGLGLIP